MTEPALAEPALNLLGGRLLPCSYAPLTGYYRDGCCKTGESDLGKTPGLRADDHRVPALQPRVY